MTPRPDVVLRTEALSVEFPTHAPFVRRPDENAVQAWWRSWRRPAATVKAVTDVALEVYRGETLGIVGESGSGKSTLGKALLGLLAPTRGRVWFGDQDLNALDRLGWRALRRRMQLIFQDPYASLDPRLRIGAALREPLRIHDPGCTGAARDAKIAQLLADVGLPADAQHRYPHQFSGGQRQRIGLARALSVAPELLVCDEPVSALDVSIQAQIINLLADLQAARGLTYVFISHDLRVIGHLATRVAVMYLGRIVEIGPTAEIFARPQHPYTQALLSAMPELTQGQGQPAKRIVLRGEVPNPLTPPTGCAFHPRCPAVNRPEACRTHLPVLQATGTCAVACHLVTKP